ncbi:cell division cycle- protein [Mortierella sp. GBA39]|nr:cell division cycle- protein [Mortierella sp. GBA39]
MSTHPTHQTKTAAEQSMPDNKISTTYTSIIKHPSTERSRPSSLNMSIKQTAQAPQQTESLSPLQHTDRVDIKRPQKPLFEPRKKAKILLETGHGKSVNHFSQSARVLQSRPQGTPSEQPLALDSGTPVIKDISLQDQHRGHDSGRKISLKGIFQLLSFIENIPFASTIGRIILTNRFDTSIYSNNHSDDNSENSRSPSTVLSQKRHWLSISAASAYSLLDILGSSERIRKQVLKTAFFRFSFLRITLLVQQTTFQDNIIEIILTTLVTPLMTKLETNALLPIRKSTTLSEDTPWMQRNSTNKDDKVKNDTEPLHQESSDENEDDQVGDGTVEELQVGSALESCTAAMTALSPPSAKKISKASVSSSLRMLYQPSFVDLDPEAISLSLPNPGSGTITFTLLDDDSHDHTSHEQPLGGKDKVCRPHTSHKSQSSSSISTNTKRPIMWRRHQTMISSRSEFMKTLETNNVSTKKAVVIVSDNYIPDPLREECQILPSTNFITKPNDTTRRVSPKTVVDVLEGKYKDQYDLLHIIDCRFPYEFEGGHIKSAVNINTTDELDKLLLQPATTDKRVLLIFHCEFSSKRAPRLARHLRNQDRAWNVSHYPALFYPEVYVMEGGYSSFFEENKSYCWPEAYVKM